MRQPGKNNRQRGRGRRNGNGQINRNTTLDSNGPDVRLRGNALQLHEKYVSLGNDAAAAGERISAEAYYQYADHYFRIHSAVVASSEERRKDSPDMNGHANGYAQSGSRYDDQSEDRSDDQSEDQPETKSGNGVDAADSETEEAADEPARKSPSRRRASAKEVAGDEQHEAEAAS